MNDTEILLATEAIKRLKARYFRFVDAKDWASYAALFTDDVHFDIGTDAQPCVLNSPQAIVDLASAGLSGCVSVHHGHCAEIDVTSATSAEGIWAMEDMLRWADPATSVFRTLHGYGHYLESYVRIDGEWRIKTLKLTRLRVDTTDWDIVA